jgi:hypothetical protein
MLGWMPVRGLRFTNVDRALARLRAMEHAWERRAFESPWLKWQFSSKYRLFTIHPGQSFADVVNAIPGFYASTLGGSTE